MSFQNGATCFDKVNSFFCECLKGKVRKRTFIRVKICLNKAIVESTVRIKSMSVTNLWILVEMEEDVKHQNLDTNVIADLASQVQQFFDGAWLQ